MCTKSDVHCAKNLQVITRCGTRTSSDKDITEPIKHIEKNDYPNCQKHKDLFKDENVFEQITANEDKEQAKITLKNKFFTYYQMKKLLNDW